MGMRGRSERTNLHPTLFGAPRSGLPPLANLSPQPQRQREVAIRKRDSGSYHHGIMGAVQCTSAQREAARFGPESALERRERPSAATRLDRRPLRAQRPPHPDRAAPAFARAHASPFGNRLSEDNRIHDAALTTFTSGVPVPDRRALQDRPPRARAHLPGRACPQNGFPCEDSSTRASPGPGSGGSWRWRGGGARTRALSRLLRRRDSIAIDRAAPFVQALGPRAPPIGGTMTEARSCRRNTGRRTRGVQRRARTAAPQRPAEDHSVASKTGIAQMYRCASKPVFSSTTSGAGPSWPSSVNRLPSLRPNRATASVRRSCRGNAVPWRRT